MREILAAGIRTAVVLSLVLGATGLPAATGPDEAAPVVLVLPTAPVPDGDTLEVRARVLDPSGVREVTLHARGSDEETIHTFAMERSGTKGDWVSRLEPWPGRGSRLHYWIEASDVRGNGPTRAGSQRSPYVAKVVPAEALVATGGGAAVLRTFLVLVPVAALFWLAHARVRRAELADLERKRHEAEAASPRRSRRSRRTRRPLAAASVATGPAGVAAPTPIDPLRRQLEEELFWLHLLAPLLDLSSAATEVALRDLASRPHAHPHDGLCHYDRRTLHKRLEWARRVDPAALVERWRKVRAWKVRDARRREQERQGTGRQPPRRAASGVTLPELLVALVILGITLGIGALYLRPAAAPLKSGAEMVEAIFKQARTKAMATTTVHRVRPIDERSLVVEYAAACSSEAWTLDPRMDLALPAEVELATTEWSACFTSRGITTENFVVTLEHGEADQSLELLLGGSVRWLP
jgi:prepilin-type N-terminal cleavage/methylation domain-containing protein